MIEIIQYEFMQRAFMAGAFIALSCSLLGVFLVLRKQAFIGEGLAHISFGGIALGIFFGAYPLLVSVIVTILGALGIMRLREKARLYGDTAIGILSYTGFALGVFLVSIRSGFTADLFNYLFGNILSISMADVAVSVILSLIILLALALFYSELFMVVFDETLARTSGVKVSFFNAVIYVITAVTIVIAMRVVGIFLAASLIIFPAASALQVSRDFRSTLFISSAISLSTMILGIILSYYFDFATGATVILLNFMLFLACTGLNTLKHSSFIKR